MRKYENDVLFLSWHLAILMKDRAQDEWYTVVVDRCNLLKSFVAGNFVVEVLGIDEWISYLLCTGAGNGMKAGLPFFQSLPHPMSYI